jgi:hypothetical protein
MTRLFEKLMLGIVFVASLPSFAQTVTPPVGEAGPLNTFRRYVWNAQVDKSTLASEISTVRVTVKKGNTAGSIVFEKHEDAVHGVVEYRNVPATVLTGDSGLIGSYKGRGIKKENANELRCVRDKAWCRSVALSDLNYVVTPLPDTVIDGVAVAHYALKAKQVFDGMTNCELWINKETYHLVRETGEALGISGAKALYDRQHVELGADSVLSRESYVTSIFILGTYNTTMEYTATRIVRRECDAACLEDAHIVSGL